MVLFFSVLWWLLVHLISTTSTAHDNIYHLYDYFLIDMIVRMSLRNSHVASYTFNADPARAIFEASASSLLAFSYFDI